QVRTSTSPRPKSLARLRGRSSAFPSTFQSGTTAVQTVRWAQVCRRRTSPPGTRRLTGAAVANVRSYERSLDGVDRLQGFRLEDEPVGRPVEPTYRQELRHASLAIDTGNVDDQVDGQRDGFADASMRQSDVGCQHAMR